MQNKFIYNTATVNIVCINSDDIFVINNHHWHISKSEQVIYVF